MNVYSTPVCGVTPSASTSIQEVLSPTFNFSLSTFNSFVHTWKHPFVPSHTAPCTPSSGVVSSSGTASNDAFTVIVTTFPPDAENGSNTLSPESAARPVAPS